MSSLFELCRLSGHDIFAVPYRGRRACNARRLPAGAIVEAALPDQRMEIPANVPDCFEVAQGGVAATIHHVHLGLVVGRLTLSGVYLLPDGDVAAVYGAEVVPLGQRPLPVA